MNPLSFFFNGSQQSGGQWFNPTTQGVSTYSSGVNPAALEAQCDFGGNLFQYSTINELSSVGGLMGLFGAAASNTIGTIVNVLATAAQLFAASGG